MLKLKGRLRNSYFPKINVLYPLFEAIVNSIYSIDALLKSERTSSLIEGFIRIKIISSNINPLTPALAITNGQNLKKIESNNGAIPSKN